MYNSIYKPIVYQRPKGRKEVAYLSRFGILKWNLLWIVHYKPHENIILVKSSQYSILKSIQ